MTSKDKRPGLCGVSQNEIETAFKICVLRNVQFIWGSVYCIRLYQRYDFHHRGMINYKDFLMRLGVNVEHALTYHPQEGAHACKAKCS